jgi:hypothetical protein
MALLTKNLMPKVARQSLYIPAAFCPNVLFFTLETPSIPDNISAALCWLQPYYHTNSGDAPFQGSYLCPKTICPPPPEKYIYFSPEEYKAT